MKKMLAWLFVGMFVGAAFGTPAKDWADVVSHVHAKEWGEVIAKARAFEKAHPENRRVTSGYVKLTVLSARQQQGDEVSISEWDAVATNVSFSPRYRLRAVRGKMPENATAQNYWQAFAEGRTIDGASLDIVSGLGVRAAALLIQAGNLREGTRRLLEAANVQGLNPNRKAIILKEAAHYGNSKRYAEQALNTMDVNTVPYEDVYVIARSAIDLGVSETAVAEKVAAVLVSRMVDTNDKTPGGTWAEAGTVRVRRSGERVEIHAIEALLTHFVNPTTLGDMAWGPFIVAFRNRLQDLTAENKAFFSQIKKAAEMVD